VLIGLFTAASQSHRNETLTVVVLSVKVNTSRWYWLMSLTTAADMAHAWLNLIFD